MAPSLPVELGFEAVRQSQGIVSYAPRFAHQRSPAFPRRGFFAFGLRKPAGARPAGFAHLSLTELAQAEIGCDQAVIGPDADGGFFAVFKKFNRPRLRYWRPVPP